MKGDIDHFGALNFLQGLLTVIRDSGSAGMLIVLDEVETIQRVRSDVRDKSLNALRQQLMALVLQESGIGRNEWYRWVEAVSGFRDMPADRIEQVVEYMLDSRILWDEAGILGMDQEGEASFGRRNFMELFSVFTSPPLFTILYGRQELGSVDQTTFLSKQDGPRILLLGGRAWQVNHIDWPRKRAYVEPTEARGRTRWAGEGQGLSFALCQSIKRLLAGSWTRDCWSRRASEYLGESWA